MPSRWPLRGRLAEGGTQRQLCHANLGVGICRSRRHRNDIPQKHRSPTQSTTCGGPDDLRERRNASSSGPRSASQGGCSRPGARRDCSQARPRQGAQRGVWSRYASGNRFVSWPLRSSLSSRRALPPVCPPSGTGGGQVVPGDLGLLKKERRALDTTVGAAVRAGRARARRCHSLSRGTSSGALGAVATGRWRAVAMVLNRKRGDRGGPTGAGDAWRRRWAGPSLPARGEGPRRRPRYWEAAANSSFVRGGDIKKPAEVGRGAGRFAADPRGRTVGGAQVGGPTLGLAKFAADDGGPLKPTGRAANPKV